MKRVASTVGALVTVATLGMAFPSTALGASGQFDYTDSAGHAHTLVDPVRAQCIDFPEGTAFKVRNLTNATATLFGDRTCDGNYTTLSPGKSAPPTAAFMSVVFSG